MTTEPYAGAMTRSRRVSARGVSLVGASAATILMATGCGTGGTAPEPTTIVSVPATTSSDPRNARGAITAPLGDEVTVPGLVTIAGTTLASDGCTANSAAPDAVAKRTLTATVTTYNVTQVEWLWPSEFDYVDENGKIIRNVDVSDASPCANGKKVIDLPPNASADAVVTLDIPRNSTAIGYTVDAGGRQQRIEWELPGDALARTEPVAAPTPEPEPMNTVSPAPDFTVPSEPVDVPSGPPNPYPNSNDSYGRPSGSSGAFFVECADPNLYQRGTGVYSDGSFDYAPQCAG